MTLDELDFAPPLLSEARRGTAQPSHLFSKRTYHPCAIKATGNQPPSPERKACSHICNLNSSIKPPPKSMPRSFIQKQQTPQQPQTAQARALCPTQRANPYQRPGTSGRLGRSPP